MREGFKHILVGIDFSRASEEAFATALRLARRDGAKVTAVHVATDTLPDGSWPWAGIRIAFCARRILRTYCLPLILGLRALWVLTDSSWCPMRAS